MTHFQNPLGGTMPPENKRRLVEILTRHEIALIEDDVYSELWFGSNAPQPAKSLDKDNNFFHCSSFSKCLAPGFRVGWVAAGKHARKIQQLQMMSTVSASMPTQQAIAEYMDKSISFYDAGAEGFYHGLVLGLIALMDNQYKIKSNRESGDGRYDICLNPREHRYPGIIMELKWRKHLGEEDLAVLAEEALGQIDDNRYDVELKEDGVQDILKLGIAFSGKKVSVRTKE